MKLARCWGFVTSAPNIFSISSPIFVNEPLGQVGLLWGQEELLSATQPLGLIDWLEKLDGIAASAGAHGQEAGPEADVFSGAWTDRP